MNDNAVNDQQDDMAAFGGNVGANQYLTFFLQEEEYGIDILRVGEIKGWNKATPLPNSPGYLQGVINLRGTIVPIIDLRLRFGLPKLEYTAMTVVIVVKLKSEKGERTVGMIVDAVSDTHNINPADIRPCPEMGTVISGDYITGLATVKDKMVIMLDVDHLLSESELERTEAAAGVAPKADSD